MPNQGPAHLEFDKIRKLLASLTTSYLGQEMMLRMEPLPTRAKAEETLNRVGALRKRAEAGRGMPPLEVPDLASRFQRLDREGAVLSPDAFLDLGRLLRGIRVARDYLDEAAEDVPHAGHPNPLSELGEGLFPLPHLERRLEAVFEPTGEIRDGASSDLRRIRRERERTREQIRTRLERLATKLSQGDTASLVTLREGRYVVSVPGSLRAKVEGIVQDRSGSGSTLFIEPLALVGANNDLREKDVEEQEEIRRILAGLTVQFAAEAPGLERAWKRLGVLDGLRARVLLALRWGGTEPGFTDQAELRLRGARHPLLLEAKGAGHDPEGARAVVVPLSLELDPSTRILLITGPNMGGKTVALKSVGLLSVMAQSGCSIPARDDSVLPWCDRWVVDVGDEQSLEDDMSTFAGHLRRWGEALESAGSGSLVLLDELGSGTDPSEGAALARSVLERLVEGGGLAVVTTHLGSLKAFAAETEGIRNASMIFDPASRQPSFVLAPGIPGESHALEMARRLGFPSERVDRAEELLPKEERSLRMLLAEVSEEREALRRSRDEAEAALGRAEKAEREARERLERFLEERGSLRAKAARQARDIIQRAESEAQHVKKERRAETREQNAARQERARHTARLARLESPRARPVTGETPETVAVGEIYWAESLGRDVEILRGTDDRGRVQVRSGSLKVELPIETLRVTSAEAVASPRATAAPVVRVPEVSEPVSEVHLLGQRVEEAVASLDKALDRALLAGISELRVVHGFGTGALHRAVTEYCRHHSAVKTFRPGERGEGGAGATVVRLVD